MEKLLQQSEGLVTRTLSLKRRYLFDQVNWKNRLIGIKGAAAPERPLCCFSG